MKKLLLIVLSSLFLTSTLTIAQQKGYDWRVGISGGYSNYYGDLTPHRLQGLSNWDAIHHLFYYNPYYVDELSYKISVEKKLSPSLGIMFSYGQYTYGMSDRYIRRDGTLMLNNPNFERALNFQNVSRDMGLSFVFNTDNGILLPANSFIAPYLTIGGGFLDFDVRGDLLNDVGGMYNYSSPEKINDGVYETNLTRLRTERPDGYSTGVFYANFGLGLRFRLGTRMELFVQSDFIHAFTDYLDDVSGPYRDTYDNNFQEYAARPGTNVVSLPDAQRGDPNNPNDWIIYHGIGLKYNFGATKKTFRAPKVSTFYPDYTITSTRTTQPTESTEQIDEIDAPAERQTQIPTGNSYTYFNNIQIVPDQGMDSLAYRSQILDWEQKIQNRENLILSGRLQSQDLQNMQNEIIRESNLLRQDTVLAPSFKDSLLNVALKNRIDIRYRLDSIQRREGEIRSEIDSLQDLKENYRMQPSTYSLPRGLDRILWRQDEELTPSLLEQDDISTRSDTTSLPPQTLRSSSDEAIGQTNQMVPASPPEQTTQRDQEQQRAAYTQQLEQRLRNMELENRRLQAQQQTLRQQPAETVYIAPRGTTTQPSRTVVPRDRQSTPTYTSPVEDPNKRVRDRSPRALPFIGLFRSRNVVPSASPDQEISDEETIEMGEEIRESLRLLGQSINLAFFGISLTSTAEEEIPQELPEEEEEVVKPTESVEIADSLLIEDPEFRLLKSKVEVFFEVNQVQPAMEEMKKLASLVDFVKDNEDYKLYLRGFADNTGNVAYNLKLIESRIEEVKNVLIKSYGVPPTQIESEVGGQIVRGASRSANENDRKVEVRIERR
ncbi:MAG TPA: OmpA family protein [Anditalea sp.]|nr:OmpA family protein [Anditalea sp.]